MSELLKQLGIDPEDLKWYHLAACNGMMKSIHDNNNTGKMTHELDPFFDAYESDAVIQVQVDQICLACPVAKQCFKFGTDTKSDGVFGGIYLYRGKIDKRFNSHKTPEVWKALKKIHGKLDD